MKKLEQLCIAGVFTFVLTTTTFAGHIGTPGITPPPPPLPSASSAIRQGDIATGGIHDPQVISNSVAEMALNLLQTMLLVF